MRVKSDIVPPHILDMFEKNMDSTNLSVSINGDLDSTSSAGTSSDHSAVQHDNISSPMAYGSLFLPNAGKSYSTNMYSIERSYLGLAISDEPSTNIRNNYLSI